MIITGLNQCRPPEILLGNLTNKMKEACIYERKQNL